MVLGAGVLLAGCGGAAQQTGQVPVQTGTATTVVSTGSAPGDQAGYLSALRAINPGLVSNESRAIDRGKNTCQEIKAGKDAATVASNASQRFSGGSVTLTAEQAAKVVDAVRQHLCG
ncbi:hypothetical protein GCM10010174_70040 [Kutzneria viridogrisea]